MIFPDKLFGIALGILITLAIGAAYAVKETRICEAQFKVQRCEIAIVPAKDF